MSIETFKNRWGHEEKIKDMKDDYLVSTYRYLKLKRDNMTKKTRSLNSGFANEIIKISALISRMRKEIDKRKLIV